MEESARSSKCRTFKVIGSFYRGRPRKTWIEIIRSDLKERRVSKVIAKGILGNLSKAIVKPMQAWKTEV